MATQHHCGGDGYPCHCGGDGYLEQEVERHPGEDGVGEELNDAEEGKHDPVREPLSVIFLVLRVNGLAPVGGGRRSQEVLHTQLARTHTHGRTAHVRGVGWVHEAD